MCICFSFSRVPFGAHTEDAAIKRCPFCHVPIERNDGCAQMMCKRCKHVFCWYCLESLDVSGVSCLSFFTVSHEFSFVSSPSRFFFLPPPPPPPISISLFITIFLTKMHAFSLSYVFFPFLLNYLYLHIFSQHSIKYSMFQSDMIYVIPIT